MRTRRQHWQAFYGWQARLHRHLCAPLWQLGLVTLRAERPLEGRQEVCDGALAVALLRVEAPQMMRYVQCGEGDRSRRMPNRGVV